jgi:hypothetical protein
VLVYIKELLLKSLLMIIQKKKKNVGFLSFHEPEYTSFSEEVTILKH